MGQLPLCGIQVRGTHHLGILPSEVWVGLGLVGFGKPQEILVLWSVGCTLRSQDPKPGMAVPEKSLVCVTATSADQPPVALDPVLHGHS